MAVQVARCPATQLLRIGRPPDPLGWPAPEFRGGGRFDDPAKRFGVLYTAPTKRACFLETLDVYRPDTTLLQRLAVMRDERATPQSGLIPEAFFARVLGVLRLADGQRWLDVRVSTPATAMALSLDSAFASQLPELGYGTRIKPGDLFGSDRRVTQAVAQWARGHDFAGIAYNCSHDLRLDCWAIFEGALFSSVESPLPIAPDDPELIAVAKDFDLSISSTYG